MAQKQEIKVYVLGEKNSNKFKEKTSSKIKKEVSKNETSEKNSIEICVTKCQGDGISGIAVNQITRDTLKWVHEYTIASQNVTYEIGDFNRFSHRPTLFDYTQVRSQNH